MPRDRKVAIIGGSLVGPATARFLENAGVKHIRIFEALRQPHSQSGGVMGLQPTTLDALSTIGVRPDAVRAIGPAVESHDIASPGRSVYRSTAMYPGTVTSWDAMYRALSADAPVEFGQRLTSIRPDGRRFVLSFASGLEDDADCVLFADGRKSFGRDVMDPDRPLRYNGYIVWRGTADPLTKTRVRGFERFYDIRGSRLFSVTEPLMQSGKTYWELSHNLSARDYATIANGRGPTDHAYILPGQIGDKAREVITAAADRLPQEFRDMIAGSEVSGIPVNDVPMPERASFSTEAGASAALLGDALIPVRLQVGAGLNQGVTQAAELADVVASPDLPTAFRRWERAILERLGPIVELGRSRAHRINLGSYEPVWPGRTASPVDGTPFGAPGWVTA